MFAEEKPHLRVLPLEPFRFYRFGTRTVHLDGAVEVEGAYYHLPPAWLGRRVAVQWDLLRVRILDPTTGRLVREHVLQKRGGRRLREEDRPARTPPTTLTLLARAASAGPHIGALCEAVYRQDGETGVRSRSSSGTACRASKRCARRPSSPRCRPIGSSSAPSREPMRRRRSPKQIDPLIRQLTLYRDAIERLTQERDLA